MRGGAKLGQDGGRKEAGPRGLTDGSSGSPEDSCWQG